MWVSVCVCVCEAGAGRERDRAHDLWSQKFFLWFDSTEGICMWFCQILGNTLNQIHDLGIWGHQIPAPNSCEDWLAVTNSHGDFCLLPTSHGWDWNFFLVTSLWMAAEIFPVYTSKELRSVVPALCSRLSDAAAAAAKSLQSCPTLCNPIDGSLPGSPIPGILQARTLEWVAISFPNTWKWKVKVKLLSRVRLLVTPWTAAYLLHPWDFPGKSTGVGCHCLLLSDATPTLYVV